VVKHVCKIPFENRTEVPDTQEVLKSMMETPPICSIHMIDMLSYVDHTTGMRVLICGECEKTR
jgi:hypothetical protein